MTGNCVWFEAPCCSKWTKIAWFFYHDVEHKGPWESPKISYWVTQFPTAFRPKFLPHQCAQTLHGHLWEHPLRFKIRLENKPWTLQVGSPIFPWKMARFKFSIQPTTCPSAVVESLQYHNLNQTHPWCGAKFMTVSTTLALPPGHNSRTRCVEVIGVFHTTWKDKSKQCGPAMFRTFSLEKKVGQDFRQLALHQTNWHPKLGIQKF